MAEKKNYVSEDNLKDDDLEKVAGGIDKENRRENDSCPKCYLPVRYYTDAMIEGKGVKPTYTCEYCSLKWIARSFYNNALVQHEMISYEAVNGVHQYLGTYRDLQRQ